MKPTRIQFDAWIARDTIYDNKYSPGLGSIIVYKERPYRDKWGTFDQAFSDKVDVIFLDEWLENEEVLQPGEGPYPVTITIEIRRNNA